MAPTPAWGPFAAVALVELLVLTMLARRSDSAESTEGVPVAVLLVGGVLPHAVLGAVVVAAARFAAVPGEALGVPGAVATTAAVPVGLVLGLVLYGGDELATRAAAALGRAPDASLREAIAPTSRPEWALLLLVVLPVSAGFEELLFRGVLVGALSSGFGLSPWLLVVLSSVAFAVGHGAQGSGGIWVTGVLGFALAVAFVVTGSLLVVVVAHYLVNALEFVVHEGLDVDPGTA